MPTKPVHAYKPGLQDRIHYRALALDVLILIFGRDPGETVIDVQTLVVTAETGPYPHFV